MENIVPQVGTRPGPLIAAYLSVRSERVRDWKRRGLIGPSCDVHSRQEGFEVMTSSKPTSDDSRHHPPRPVVPIGFRILMAMRRFRRTDDHRQ